MSYASVPFVARGPNGKWRYLSGLGAAPTVTTVQIVTTGSGDEGTRIVQTQLQRLNFLGPGTQPNGVSSASGPTGADGKWGPRTELALANAARYVGYTEGPPFTKSGTTVTIPTALLGLMQAATPASLGTPGAISPSAGGSNSSSTTTNTTTNTITDVIGPRADQASAAAAESAAGPLIALGAGVLLVAGLVFWGSWSSNTKTPTSTKYERRRSTPLFVRGAKVTRHVRRNARGIKNDREREMWVDNDEGLYNWWRSSRMSKRDFIREHRDELDKAIETALTPREKTWRDY